MLRWHESTAEHIGNRDTYKYLLHFTGDAPSEAARYTQYDNYVLVNDPTVTWDEIFLSICSSQFGDFIPHHVIYKTISVGRTETDKKNTELSVSFPQLI